MKRLDKLSGMMTCYVSLVSTRDRVHHLGIFLS